MPKLPEKLTFIHAEDILELYPDLPRKLRETMILQEYPAVFIYGIGWPLKDGYPHEMRAADYDDWITSTRSKDGRPMHGLNGDILVWNPVTQRRHELSSMGIRVDAESLKQQLEMADQLDSLRYPYHQGIVSGALPLSIGGGIGQSRTICCSSGRHTSARSVSPFGRRSSRRCARSGTSACSNSRVLSVRDRSSGDRRPRRTRYSRRRSGARALPVPKLSGLGGNRSAWRVVMRGFTQSYCPRSSVL